MASPRLLLADDHAMVVEAFKKLLEPEFDRWSRSGWTEAAPIGPADQTGCGSS